jgi:hypothetical protein
MLRCVIGVEVIDVSKDRTAFIFRDTQLLRSYFAVNFEVCTAVFWGIKVFWPLALCRWVGAFRRFGVTQNTPRYCQNFGNH